MSVIFDKIELHFKQKLPFVVYCKPNSKKTIGLFQKNDALFLLNDAETGFAFVSFDNEKRFIIPENQSDIYFENNNETDFIFETKSKNSIDATAKINFENLIQKALDAIENRQFEKVVVSRKELVAIENIDIENLFNKLIFNYKTAFKYCFYHPEIGLWVGASPEQFIKIENHNLKTVALAGTQLFVENKTLIWQQKEIDEQKVVTDYIVATLKNFSNEVVVSKPYTFQAGTIAHIKTDIEATINTKNKEALITALHPTPAVCGFPKEVAKQFIVENEGYNREYYAGFFGEWNKNFATFETHQSDLFVNLRCMKIENNQASLFVGCGINKNSIPEKEFEETENKALIMKKVL